MPPGNPTGLPIFPCESIERREYPVLIALGRPAPMSLVEDGHQDLAGGSEGGFADHDAGVARSAAGHSSDPLAALFQPGEQRVRPRALPGKTQGRSAG